tara:strand:- start:185 stop:451 length:267 start_codon:yes stop_codon:yes gene_type:complete
VDNRKSCHAPRLKKKGNMATILDELIDELSAKEKRIAKEVINIDRSSVIPDHYKKAEAILQMADEGIKTRERARYLLGLKHEIEGENG